MRFEDLFISLLSVDGVLSCMMSISAEFFLDLLNELNMEYANTDFTISFHRNLFPDGFPETKPVPITDSEITSTIASLKSKNSSGYGGI